MGRVIPCSDWSKEPSGPYRVEHDLPLEPWLALESLADHARDFDRSAIPSGRRANPEPPAPATVIGEIGSTPGWAVFRDECWQGEPALGEEMASIREWSATADPGTWHIDRSVIVSSAGAVTRLHLDIDESYLLQVHGRKTVCFLPPDEDAQQAAAELQRGRGRRLSATRAQALRMRKFVIGPGQGVHVPYGWPHATRVGDAYSISVSLAFQTDRTLELRRRALEEGLSRW